ncbi:MAG: hypothetical protein ACP5RP_00795 [Candidatus Micrarchaeia archaeon]
MQPVPFQFPGYEIAVMLVAVTIAVFGIVLGLGYAFNDKRMKEFAQEEIFTALINGVIIGTLIISFSPGGIFSRLVNNMVINSNITAQCPSYESSNYAICFASSFLIGNGIDINNVHYTSLLYLCLESMLAMSGLYVALGILGGIKVSAVFISFSLSSVFHPMLGILSNAMELLASSLVSIYAQAILLHFIAVTSTTVLMPVAIVLRSFYFTKRLGGAILAISIGLFAVLPLTYLFNAQLISEYGTSTLSYQMQSISSNIESSTNQIIYYGGKANSSSIVGSAINSAMSYYQDLQNILQPVFSFIALVCIEVFFLPIFSIILTVISIRELARLMNSEVSFGRLFIF